MIFWSVSRHFGDQQKSLDITTGDTGTFPLMVFRSHSLTNNCVICMTTATLTLQLLLLRNKSMCVHWLGLIRRVKYICDFEAK